MYTQPQRATTAAEWADDATQMLRTYSTRPAGVVAFARTRGALGGIWVADTTGLTMTAENGWTVRYDGARFVAA
jgi:hypothetical protein